MNRKNIDVLYIITLYSMKCFTYQARQIKPDYKVTEDPERNRFNLGC